jgi:hypothetical protein
LQDPSPPNDNPQIESLFSTVKKSPDYPGRFSSLEEVIKAQRKRIKERNFRERRQYHHNQSKKAVA